MIAQWDSSLSVLPVVRVQFPIMAENFKELFLADHMCCLVHGSGRTKEWSSAPLEKSLQSHEDHEMPTDWRRPQQKTGKKPYAPICE